MIGESKGAAAITNYDEVIVAKIKTCRSNFRSGSFNPWRSSDFDLCRSSDVDRSSGGAELKAMATNRLDDSLRRGRVERIMKGVEGSGDSEFCDSDDCTKPNKQEAMISDQELETNRNNLISDRS